MQRIGNPVPLFIDTRGLLLDGGHIYVGAVSADPQTSPITVYSDAALTIPLTQPIRTLGGFAVSGATPVFLFIAEQDYSMRVTDNVGALVAYSPSVYTDTAAFQAASDVLDAIVTNGLPTAYGLALLLLSDVNALKAALGGLNFVPSAGGTMTGEITRSGAGVVSHWDDPTMVSGKKFIRNSGDPDPTTGIGDTLYVRAS